MIKHVFALKTKDFVFIKIFSSVCFLPLIKFKRVSSMHMEVGLCIIAYGGTIFYNFGFLAGVNVFERKRWSYSLLSCVVPSALAATVTPLTY